MKLKDLTHDAVFLVESAKIDFALEIRKAMVANGLNKSTLAKNMKVSPPQVTKILRGDANVTIDTMVRASMAAGGKLFVKVVRDGTTARFFEVVEKTMARSGHNVIPHSLVGSAISRQTESYNWNIACNDDIHEAQSAAA